MRVVHRYPEIDLLRGLAVIGMVVYHEVFIIVYLTHNTLWWPSPLPRLFGYLVAFTFLFVFGLSAYLKYFRLQQRHVSVTGIYIAFARRGIQLAIAALVVTMVTYLVMPTFFVQFGILHLLALSTFLLPLCVSSRKRVLITSFLVVFFYLLLGSWRPSVTTSLFLPLNLMPANYQALDHWPLLPYFIVPLFGALFGFRWYAMGQRSFSVSTRFTSRWIQPLLWSGQHALLIYLLHAPLLVAATWVVVRW